jgi:hypothetical protein
MKGWVRIQILTPQDRIAEFHEMYGHWLRNPDKGNHEHAVATEVPTVRSWADGSREELLRDAIIVYGQLSSGAQKFIDYWLDDPDRRVSAKELAKRLEFNGQQAMAGSLASIGVRCRRVGREVPYQSEPDYGGGWYGMDPDVTDLFREARAVVRSEPKSMRHVSWTRALQGECNQIDHKPGVLTPQEIAEFDASLKRTAGPRPEH